MLLEEEFIQQKPKQQQQRLVIEDDVSSSDSQSASSIQKKQSDDDDDDNTLLLPLMMNPSEDFDTNSIIIRRSCHRNNHHHAQQQQQQQRDNKTPDRRSSYNHNTTTTRHQQQQPVTTITTKKYAVVMMLLARLLFWTSVCATVAAVIWYSYELKNNGTNPHLIAFFSAGAFVLLGFPISIYGIVMHLANYNQPNIQVYIIRILWMVPIYSMGSWLCLRYHEKAIYIETLRDFYESYVLYSFLQFLIQVLGGEDELILLLKDKSPTRGVHMWGLQYCLRPWLMGVPVSRSVVAINNNNKDDHYHHHHEASTAVLDNNNIKRTPPTTTTHHKQVKWTSPFFVRCKFGVLQYVLLKFVLSIITMILELKGVYKEGNFTPKGGYLYICILTNLSQCWALYGLIFFYFATVTELTPIRPVGKFLSVKAIVFFTWWQSVCISMIYQMNLIPHYHYGSNNSGGGEDANSSSSSWTPEDVAKGLQDYLICIEMFVASLVHVFVFPHTDYLPQAVQARTKNQQQQQQYTNHHTSMLPHHHGAGRRVVGRLVSPYGWLYNSSSTTTSAGGGSATDDRSKNSKSKSSGVFELSSTITIGDHHHHHGGSVVDNNTSMTVNKEEQSSLLLGVETNHTTTSVAQQQQQQVVVGGDDRMMLMTTTMMDDPQPPATTTTTPGFMSALLDSTINTALPRDILQNSAGIIKGDYVIEKKTLLQHASTSDAYDLFDKQT